MKRIFQAAIIIALIIGTIRPSAGQLNILGDVNVASNLTVRTISGENGFGGAEFTLGGGVFTLAGGLEIQRSNNTLLYAGFGGGIGWLQAYGDPGWPGRLGLNSNGGQVSVGTWDTIDEDGSYGFGVTVGPDAKFESDVEVDGKLNVYGGMDPPYLLLDSETRSNIANRVAREVPPSKQTGAALFWNNQTKQLEVYIASEGAYYDLTGKLLVSIQAPVAANATIISSYRIDPVAGGIVARDSVHVPRWQLKPGYRFNSLTGVFTQVGGDSNAVPQAVSSLTGVPTQVGSESNATPEAVSAQEALELK